MVKKPMLAFCPKRTYHPNNWVGWRIIGTTDEKYVSAKDKNGKINDGTDYGNGYFLQKDG